MLELNINPKYAARTVGSSIYETMRDEILNLNLKPGEALSIKDVADALGVSRSPVRDAFMRLEAERLVHIYPQSGCRVSLIDLEQVRQEFFLREGLELLAVKQCIAHFENIPCHQMEKALLAHEKAVREEDAIRSLKCDDAFHDVFFEAVGQQYAQKIIRTHCAHYHRIRLLSFRYLDANVKTSREHRAMLNAILKRDEEELLRLTYAHIHCLDEQRADMERMNPAYFVKRERMDERWDR